MRVFPLSSASAEEIAGVITAAIASVTGPQAAAGGAAVPAELQVARSAVLEYLDATGSDPRLLRSGLLADVRVTPDPRTNSLLVTADEQSLPLIEALIERLDRPSAAVAELKVFTLENSDATAVVELLQSLFGTTTAGGNAAAGVQLAGATDAGSSLVPLRFATDIRTNSVIASGGPEALRVVEAVLLRLDENDVRQRETTVIKLKNAYAPDVAIAINQFLTSQRDLATIDPDLVSNVQLLERELIVVPDAQSNSLLVSSTPQYFDEIVRIIEKLDQAPPQVIIQAMLVEVTLDNTDELGVELGFQDSTLFDRSLSAAQDLTTLNVTNTAPNGVQTTSQQLISRAASPGFLFNNVNPLGNNVASTNPNAVGTQGINNFSLGRTNADLGYGGFVFSASSANVSVLLRALSAKRTVQVLSRPQIRALDNQVAQIQVGQVVPVVNGVTLTATGTAFPQVIRDNAGLILTIVPRISPDGTVVMEVAAERSAYTGANVPIFTDATSGNVVNSPIKDITTARSTVAVPTGQTIVMGGIITRSDDTIERKVPYLGDVPYLGQLFRFDSTRTRRSELLIFLTPRVIYTDADSELIKQVEADRLHFIEHEAEMIHGPLYGVPPAGPVGPGAFVPGGFEPGAFGPNGPIGPPEFVPPVLGPTVAPPLPALRMEGLDPGFSAPGSLGPPTGPQGAREPASRDAETEAVVTAGGAVGTGRLAGATELTGATAEPPKPKRSFLGR